MPSDPRDYQLDLTTPVGGVDAKSSQSKSPADARPFLRALFACCNVYHRIYRHTDGDRYEGACPKCGKRVRFTVGSDGTTCRSFVIQ